MSVSSRIFGVFGHFQNLNLLALLQDLRDGHTTRQAWATGALLCPVAHGLPDGGHVRDLLALGQTADLSEGCDFAARHLGAHSYDVLNFVSSWDDALVSSISLLRQLEEIWQERLADAEAVQELVQGGTSGREGIDSEGQRSIANVRRGSLAL